MYILHIALAHLHMDAHLHMEFDEKWSMCMNLYYPLWKFKKTGFSCQNELNSGEIPISANMILNLYCGIGFVGQNLKLGKPHTSLWFYKSATFTSIYKTTTLKFHAQGRKSHQKTCTWPWFDQKRRSRFCTWLKIFSFKCTCTLHMIFLIFWNVHGHEHITCSFDPCIYLLSVWLLQTIIKKWMVMNLRISSRFTPEIGKVSRVHSKRVKSKVRVLWKPP